MSTAYLRCIEETCREQFPLDSKEHKCERCDSLLDVHYDFRAVHPRNPVLDPALDPALDAGRTDSLDPRALRQTLGAPQEQQRHNRPERRLALSRTVALRGRRAKKSSAFRKDARR